MYHNNWSQIEFDDLASEVLNSMNQIVKKSSTLCFRASIFIRASATFIFSKGLLPFRIGVFLFRILCMIFNRASCMIFNRASCIWGNFFFLDLALNCVVFDFLILRGKLLFLVFLGAGFGFLRTRNNIIFTWSTWGIEQNDQYQPRILRTFGFLQLDDFI